MLADGNESIPDRKHMHCAPVVFIRDSKLAVVLDRHSIVLIVANSAYSLHCSFFVNFIFRIL